MRTRTVERILDALPGVQVVASEIEYAMNERPRLKVEIVCDEQPEPHKLVITIEPGEDAPHAPITLTACAGCGAPGRYMRSKYCDACRMERRAGLR